MSERAVSNKASVRGTPVRENEPEWAGARLLVVDDDPIVLRSLQKTLQRTGYEVFTAESGSDALVVAATQDIEVALIDLHLPDGPGTDLMGTLKRRDPTLECIIFTGYTSVPSATEAYDRGAVEYFDKPITDWRRFESVLRRAVMLRRARERSPAPRGDSAASTEAAVRRVLSGGSKAMEDIRRIVAQLGPRSATVLLTGPSGSGKSAIAEALHLASGRTGRFEVVSCSALHGPAMYTELFGRVAEDGQTARSGAFDRAADGTLVLDEVADLPLELQGNLLSVLDGHAFVPAGGGKATPVTARVVVTTHEDLDALVKQGRFREDLCNRLGFRVRVPGLNERKEDIPQLVYQFLRRVSQEEDLNIVRVAPEALEALTEHDWSGSNVRGLRTAVCQAAVYSRGDTLQPEALPAEIPREPRPKRQVAGLEGPRSTSVIAGDRLPEAYRRLTYQDFKEKLLDDFMSVYLRDLLDAASGNVTRAARAAGLHRPNFRRLMKRYSVEAAGDEEDEG